MNMMVAVSPPHSQAHIRSDQISLRKETSGADLSRFDTVLGLTRVSFISFVILSHDLLCLDSEIRAGCLGGVSEIMWRGTRRRSSPGQGGRSDALDGQSNQGGRER